MRKLLTALTLAAFVAVPALAADKRCRGANGRFTACGATATPSASADIKKGADGKCRWTKTTKDHKAGTFAKCP